MRTLRITAAALAMALSLPAGVLGWNPNKLTYLTFSEPVEMPGMALPAGTYMFKHADSSTNRHVVQVFNQEGTTLYRTVMAVPEQRLKPPDKPVVMFAERQAGSPQAIRSVSFPEHTIEFVYPRHQAMEIAKATRESVLSTSDESDGNVIRVDDGVDEHEVFWDDHEDFWADQVD